MTKDANDDIGRGDMAAAVERQAERKERARRERRHGLWFGLGMFGLVGWAVAVPTLLGIALGIWLDAHLPARFSWTLTLLFAGIALGCLNAWWWIRQEEPRD
jgi:ATP synthase protein I